MGFNSEFKGLNMRVITSMLICTYKHGVAYATICALIYGYKCKHLLLLFFEPVEAKFNLEPGHKSPEREQM